MRGASARRGRVLLFSAGMLVAACAAAAADTRHPLAAAPRGGGLVLCEAGCLGYPPEIVYIEPSMGADDGAGSVLSSASAAHLIECVAGCYDTPKIYDAVLPDTAAQESGAARASTLEQKAPIKREPFSPVR